MQLIPAIDIRNGACVRLLRGAFDAETVYRDDPVGLARHYARLGAPMLHVVDLDGARDGQPVNTRALSEIVNLCPVQTGGGLRDEQSIGQRLREGAARVVIGSLAVTDPDLTLSLLRRHGADRIVLAIDVRRRDGVWRPATHGWTVDSQSTLTGLLDRYAAAGLRHTLITDIDRDGAMSGPNLDLYRDVVTAFPALAVQASGGVRAAGDLAALAACGVTAAISGKALLEKTISTTEMEPYLRSA